ncbi:S-layer homology domain-containing protein [Paenibacillus sp. HB172176]|uniref:S-layer homology domain-containing protein n=1 Tax=Paenibacillus sp. HB172176 TaxID=2493690 RepID=UPI001438FA8A|nr:S-layer homology domain-containing protein [Paenibacillus sp. HB172176]
MGKSKPFRFVAVFLLLALLLNSNVGPSFIAAAESLDDKSSPVSDENLEEAPIKQVQSAASIQLDGEVGLRWARPAYNEIEVKWSALQIYDEETRQYVPAPDIDHYSLEWKTGDTWTVLKETSDDFYYLHTGLPEASFSYYRLFVYDKDGNKSDPYPLRTATDHKETKILFSLDHEDFNDFAISEDGEVLVFMTEAQELPGAVEGETGLYAYQLSDGNLVRIDQAVPPTADSTESTLAVSGNGRYILYERMNQDGQYELCRYDAVAHLRDILTTQSKKNENVAISRDGSKIVFDSNFAYSTEDTNEVKDVYLYDAALPEANRLKRISVAWNGEQGSEQSKHGAISADGHYIAFVTTSTELIPPEVEDNSMSNLYLYDTNSGAMQYIPVEEVWNNERYPIDVTWPNLSEDGRYISYRMFVNARGLRAGLLDLSSGQVEQVWQTRGSSLISLDVPKLTTNGRYVYLGFYNYDPGTSQEPYRTRGELLFDTTQTNQYRYLGKLLDASEARLTGDGSRGVYEFWNAPYEEYEGDPGRPEGAQLVYVCLERCQEQEPPPKDKITKASLELPSQVNGDVPIGGNIIIRSLAEQGLELKADIVYESVGQTGTQSASVSLIADAAEPRAYRADWTVPEDAVRIVSARVELAGQPTEGKEAIIAPIEVAGALKVSLTTAAPELLQGAKVHLWSGGQRAGNAAVFPESLEAVIPVAGAEDYQIRITDASGNLLSERGGIVVKPGEQSELPIAVNPSAKLGVSVVDEGGTALANIRLEIRKREGELIYSGKTLPGGSLDIPFQFSMGDEIEVRAVVSSPYQSPPPAIYTLAAGYQQKEIKLVNLDYAIVGGIASLQDKPVTGVIVQALTKYGKVAAQSVTDSEGRYQLRVPAGDYDLFADRKAQPLYALPKLIPITLQESETKSIHLALTAQGFGMIDLDVQMKNIDGSLTPIAITDWRSAIHYGLTVKILNESGGARANSVNEKGIPVYGTPGDAFEICANGIEAGLASSCDTVVLDTKREATAALRLEEVAQITGSISGTETVQSMQIMWRGDSSEHWSAMRNQTLPKSGAFTESLSKAGFYQLKFYNQHFIEIYRTEFEVSQGQRITLPPIHLSGNTRLFAGQPGNGYSLGDLRASLGEAVTLRAEYQLNGSQAITNTQLVIEVAAGSSLLTNSVTLNKAPVEVTEEGGGSYAIMLGDLAPGAKGIVSYRVTIDNHMEEQSLQQLSARYQVDEDSDVVEETIGAAYIHAGDVTLEAPKLVKQKTLTVSGRAPAGKQVLIYASMSLIGSAQATQGGLWTAKVTLPDKPEGLIWEELPSYRLTAKVQTASGYAESRSQLVEIDSEAPAITNMSIEQDGGRAAVFHPEEGVSRFPFVVVPGQSIFVKLSMSNSNRISNPVVSFGQLSAPLTEESPGQFEAVIPASYEMGSGIFVSYDTTPTSMPISVEAPASEEWEAQQSHLAANWGEIKESVADAGTEGPDPQAAYTPTFSVVYPDEDAIEANVRMSVKYEKRSEYSGPYVGFEPTWDYNTGTLVVKGSIARSALTPQLLKEWKVLALQADPEPGPGPELSTDYLGITFSVAFPKAESFNKAFGYFGTLKSYVSDTMDFLDYADQLLQFQDYVIQNECYAPNVNYYVKQTESLFDMASAGLVVKNTITGIGLVAGVALSKLPTWATASAAAYMTAINDAVMSNWKSNLDDLKKEFEADKKWRDDMAAAGAIDRCKKRKDKEEDEPQNKVADPVWIWDPSGYVYEALPSNRLEGVKATLLQENLGDQAVWSEWDADWFGQQNPLITDSLGKYGWDVPEGRWRVLYTKEGYQTAQSADLEVLPPHFDVNIGMISLQPPIPTIGRAVEGRAIGMVFSKYMLANSVTASGIIVENAKGDAVGGRVEAVDAQTDEHGQLLARSFRFIPDQAFRAGEIYRMRILSHVQSYAHVGMGQEAAMDMTVLPAGTMLDQAAADLRLTSGSSQLLAKWTPRATGDGRMYRLTASPQGISTCGSIEIEVGIDRSSASFEGLCPGTSYHLTLTTVDGNGNESAGITEAFATKAVATPIVDLTPPGEVNKPRAAWEGDQLLIRWTDPIDDDFHHVQLAYRVKGASEYSEGLLVAKGKQEARLLQLNASKEYEIKLRTFDIRLNGSQGLSFMDQAEDNGGGKGGGGNTNSDPQLAEITLTSAAKESALFNQALTLKWPANTFKASGELQVKRYDLGAAMIPPGMTPMSEAFTLQSELTPLKRISLKAIVDGSLLKKADLRKAGLYRQNEDNPGKWVYVGGIVNPSKLTVRADISEWGTYALFLRESDFSDMVNHWSRQEVEVLASRGLLQGTSPRRFEPERELTRAEAVTLILSILRAAGKLSEADAHESMGSGTFADVKSGSWYEEAVELAASLRIVQGSQGRFRPGEPVTREELALILYRTFPSAGTIASSKALESFQDADSVSEWAISAMQAAVEEGLLKGLSPTMLAPRAKLKRGEAAVILYRMLDRMGLITE